MAKDVIKIICEMKNGGNPPDSIIQIIEELQQQGYSLEKQRTSKDGKCMKYILVKIPNVVEK